MKMLCAALAVLPGAAFAGFDATPIDYTCDRGAQVQTVYVNDTSGDASAAIILVEGQLVTLWAEVSGSGARYSWPSDGSNYVWWTKGDTATLYWKDGAKGEETVVLDNCKEK